MGVLIAKRPKPIRLNHVHHDIIIRRAWHILLYRAFSAVVDRVSNQVNSAWHLEHDLIIAEPRAWLQLPHFVSNFFIIPLETHEYVRLATINEVKLVDTFALLHDILAITVQFALEIGHDAVDQFSRRSKVLYVVIEEELKSVCDA